MAELTFQSAGVSTREIDLSQPRRSGPIGIPAGIVGTSLEGPAFIPLTFANYSDFTATFGQSDGEKFGPIAVNQWLSNAQSVTYMRVLGVGDGLQRDNSGNVTNAGFTVGNQIIQGNGLLGDNPYANSGAGSVEGRTYFLGCYMSESAGSTIFSNAGIQTNVTSSAILRGVLLAPSGVLLQLSTGSNTAHPLKANTATTNRQGDITGSVNLGTQEFVLFMNGYNNSDPSKKTFISASFDMTSPNYFSKVLNRNPFKIEEEGHLLYTSYDIYPDLADVTGSGILKVGKGGQGTSSEQIGFLLTASFGRGQASSSTEIDYESFTDRFSHAKSPYVISQGGTSAKNLFKVHALSDGEGISNRFKVSIENIKKSSSTSNRYGTFDLVVRDFRDSDEEKIVLESFRGLSLDPTSERYIGRVIGDQNIRYNFDVAKNSQKIVVEGSHPVRSRYIRVEVSTGVKDASFDQELLPFGFRGPAHIVTSGSLMAGHSDSITLNNTTAVKGVTEPPIPYRESISLGTGIQKRSDSRLYWGIQTSRKTDPAQPNQTGLFDESFEAFVKHYPNHRTDTISFSVSDNEGAADINGSVLDSDRFNNNKFTLENILVRTGSDTLADPEYWLSASYVRRGTTAGDINHTTKVRAFSVNDLGKPANIKYAKFTLPLQGGFNGVNIFDEEKSKLTSTAIRREVANDEGSAGVNNNTVAAYRKAVDLMASKTDVDIQLLAIPGIRHSSVTDYAVQKIEDRFDAMYIMDIEEYDQTNTVITSSVQKPHVANTVASFTGRALDTSFAAAYFPDVIVQDPSTRTSIQVPPSVAVLGAFSFNDKVSHPWFAPAGYARGSLNQVENAAVRLNRTNLDDIYNADINPIVTFENAGVVIWGQKTLLANNTALDRINVRRLLIDIRRKVRNIANSLLFEPNREETLDRFNALVNPILQRVQEQSGIERYKAVIDTTTTTQADVENNTIRGKIFLQPNRSIEFVALDFVVTNAGSNI